MTNSGASGPCVPGAFFVPYDRSNPTNTYPYPTAHPTFAGQPDPTTLVTSYPVPPRRLAMSDAAQINPVPTRPTSSAPIRQATTYRLYPTPEESHDQQ